MSPSIAVIMPVRNGMPFLRESIATICAQNYAPLELVVIDEGSTDAGMDFLRGLTSIPLRILTTGGIGPAAARNMGIRASTSDLVAFLDADDLWLPGTLHTLANALADLPETGFAQGLIRNFRESPPGGRRFVTGPYRFINLGANLWRRSTLDQVGLLDEDLHLCEDLDLMMRCWEHDIRKAEVDPIALHYRRHPGGMTHGLSGAGFGALKAYKKRIDRIRRAEFDPELPRHTSLHLYLGTGPADQDGKLHAPAR